MTDTKPARIKHELDLENLKCCLCKLYLSCRPLHLLPDGSNVCGRCSSAITDSSALRMFILEKIVSNVSFPCKNESYGCGEKIVFDSEADHIDTSCAFNPLACSFESENSCRWIGAIHQHSDHLTEQHSELITERAEFTININEDTKRSLVVSQNDTVFLIDYLYNSKSFILRYTIAYFVFNLKNLFAKIQLKNTADYDYMVQLKSNCYSYDNCYNSSINIHDSLTLLKNATDILVSVIVNSLPLLNFKGCNIDYDLLNSNRCLHCKYLFMVLPQFAWNQYFICFKCKRSSDLVNSEKSSLLSAQNYPCRWNGCNTITKGNNINDHESSCNFRIYGCLDDECEAVFTFDSVKQHFLSHSCLFFENSFEGSISFNRATDRNTLVTSVFNEIVCIQYQMVNLVGSHKHYFTFTSRTYGYNKNKIQFEVKFKHQHCDAEFVTSSGLDAHFTQMPKCFKWYEEITAVIMVNCID